MADRESTIMLEDELTRGLKELSKLKPGSEEYASGAKAVSELLKCKTDDFKAQSEYFNEGERIAQDKELRNKELDIRQDEVSIKEKQIDEESKWYRNVDWGRVACGGLFFIGGLATMKFEAAGYLFKLKDFFKAIPK